MAKSETPAFVSLTASPAASLRDQFFFTNPFRKRAEMPGSCRLTRGLIATRKRAHGVFVVMYIKPRPSGIARTLTPKNPAAHK